VFVCVCVFFCFPAIVHCCTEVKCVVLGEEAPWFGIQVFCWPLLLLLLLLLSFSFVFHLFVCLFVATVGFKVSFCGCRHTCVCCCAVCVCVYLSLSLSLSLSSELEELGACGLFVFQGIEEWQLCPE